MHMVGIDAGRLEGLPARALRRDAAARDHRDGARAPPGARDHGRADHGARRRRAARDPAAVEALRHDLGFAVLFITHDLSLLLEFSDRVAIMYAGEIVESGPAESMVADYRHPYTEGLVKSFPPLTGPLERITGIPGAPPDLSDPAERLPLHLRCPHCLPGRVPSSRRCRSASPAVEAGSPASISSPCHLVVSAAW
jgi:oligopeptide/dipeptide ABC transporter ATP-binding protein